jgi:REP element-mobilizing transposase RayT
MDNTIRPTSLPCPSHGRASAASLGTRASRPPHASPWRSRGYLPHFDVPNLVQAITFRLADSVPAQIIAKWKDELRIQPGTIATDPAQVALRERVAQFEDSGHGACHLRDSRVAEMVEKALLHFDGDRYRALAWCVMPNHVHVVVETMEAHRLSEVMHAWKSFTSKQANQILGRNGTFWMAEYFDRFVRDEKHLRTAIEYVHQNPARAGLVKDPCDWQFSSAGLWPAAE